MQNDILLTRKSFYPLFWTQFFGAMNDNIFKNAMVILIAFKSYTILNLTPDQMVALSGGIFILPFFLFSSISGQLADKYSKTTLVVMTKIMEVAVMVLGAFGLVQENLILLFVSLFLMGLQSTIFGPVKYSILPELIEEDLLVKGNALVEMGTFLSILIGTLLGGILIGYPGGTVYVSVVISIFSITGLIVSLKVPKLSAVTPEMKLDANLFKSTWEVISLSRKTHSVFISILGISWFWFFGATLLSIFPIYVKEVLGGDENVVTLLLAIFSIGVAIGSIICERFSHKRVELGLVPFGSIGLCVFAIFLYFLGAPDLKTESAVNISLFLQRSHSYWVLLNIAGISVMSGFFIVPLYTFIQVRSDRESRSRVIAANNILNALFMVLASVMLMIVFSLGATVVDVFLILFGLNLLVSIYIYTVIPEFLLRFCCVILSRILYRMKVSGSENIPDEGPAVIVCNHLSFVDWLVISGSVRRPVRFVMHYSFANIPFLSFLLKGAKVIPIAGAKENPEILSRAFEQIHATLMEGEVICIFPEGKITHTGDLNPFRQGVEKIIEKFPTQVVPMALHGLWGSLFSRMPGKKSKFRSTVTLDIGKPLNAQDVNAEALEKIVKTMLEKH